MVDIVPPGGKNDAAVAFGGSAVEGSFVASEPGVAEESEDP
jgi:hypothetical protein